LNGSPACGGISQDDADAEAPTRKGLNTRHSGTRTPRRSSSLSRRRCYRAKPSCRVPLDFPRINASRFWLGYTEDRLLMPSDPLIVIARLAHILNDLQIQYVVGGSMASSVYGIPRATQDVDLMANVKLDHVERLTAALEPEFYVASELIVDAVHQQTSFNVVHLQTMFKADVFVAADNEWSREEMSRARTE